MVINPIKIKFIKECKKFGVELIYGSDFTKPISYTYKDKKVNFDMLKIMECISKKEFDFVK